MTGVTLRVASARVLSPPLAIQEILLAHNMYVMESMPHAPRAHLLQVVSLTQFAQLECVSSSPDNPVLEMELLVRVGTALTVIAAPLPVTKAVVIDATWRRISESARFYRLEIQETLPVPRTHAMV